MKIIYSPFYNGGYYMNLQAYQVALDVQVLETHGLLSQLALHAGIHQQIPSYPERLTSYHKALLEYDNSKVDNIFHRSIKIDSMSVAKTLLRWRDSLALCGWKSKFTLQGCSRLNTLAEIDSHFHDEGIATMLAKLSRQLQSMESGKIKVPQTYKDLIIEIPCSFDLLPDYIKPLLSSLRNLGVAIAESVDDATVAPKTITEIRFSQQWKAEVWLSQQQPTAYDVWINTDNKRLDNWLHMSGNPVCGSEMTSTNPQITQMFLLAIQLFQRPLNVNTLLQYLFLPECPIDWKLRRELAKTIVQEGGFCNKKVQECIKKYNDEEYLTYLPFDLRNDDSALPLAEESDAVNVKALSRFLSSVSSYAANRAAKIKAVQPYDARIAQLSNVSEMTTALLGQIDALVEGELSFTTLSQWAQSLYEEGNFTLYNAQVGGRCIINSPANMIDNARKTVWCDFYGDRVATLSTDFLSNHELEELQSQGVLLWNKQHENDFVHLMMTQPIYKTTEELTIVTCDQQGATKLPVHPLYHHLPFITKKEDADDLYNKMPTKEVKLVDNKSESEDEKIHFDAEKHPVTWRTTESYSALDKLIETPLDYFMNYTLQFTDVSETDINIFLTYGNVAHEVVELLFTADRGGASLNDFVLNEYEQAFRRGLVKKGALLLLPEHHLDMERLRYKLRECVGKLATIIQENSLTVVQCEQKEEQDLGFQGGILIQGFIDMLLRDNAGNDVVFDLKYASRKDKWKDELKKDRALQLAIYKDMLQHHENPSTSVRTAYFVMPYGMLYSSDPFFGENYEYVPSSPTETLMQQARSDYAKRVGEISSGNIEAVQNDYSDYNCFTI